MADRDALTFAVQLLNEVVPLAIKGVVGAIEALENGRRQLKAMVEEDRNPTDEEWDSLNSELDDLTNALNTGPE